MSHPLTTLVKSIPVEYTELTAEYLVELGKILTREQIFNVSTLNESFDILTKVLESEGYVEILEKPPSSLFIRRGNLSNIIAKFHIKENNVS